MTERKLIRKDAEARRQIILEKATSLLQSMGLSK